MRILILILILLFSFNAKSYIYYQTQDANGHIIFSDQPSENAKIVQLKSLNIYFPQQTDTASEASTEKNKNTYSEFSIIQPTQQQTFQNQTDIQVKFNIVPKLQKDNKISLWLDGKALQEITANNTVLHLIDRGTHQLQAKLLNQTNETLMTTEVINFYVHYHST